jgi:hypothetical protein
VKEIARVSMQNAPAENEKEQPEWVWPVVLLGVGFVAFMIASMGTGNLAREIALWMAGIVFHVGLVWMFRLRWRLIPLCIVAGGLGTPAAGFVWFGAESDTAMLRLIEVGAGVGALVGWGLYRWVGSRGGEMRPNARELR